MAGKLNSQGQQVRSEMREGAAGTGASAWILIALVLFIVSAIAMLIIPPML